MKDSKKCRLQKMALENGSLEDGSPENNEKKVILGFFFLFEEKKEIERMVDGREKEASLETIATKNC